MRFVWPLQLRAFRRYIRLVYRSLPIPLVSSFSRNHPLSSNLLHAVGYGAPLTFLDINATTKRMP